MLEGRLDEAGARDYVAVLVALDVVVGVAEDVEKFTAFQSQAEGGGAARLGSVNG